MNRRPKTGDEFVANSRELSGAGVEGYAELDLTPMAIAAANRTAVKQGWDKASEVWAYVISFTR